MCPHSGGSHGSELGYENDVQHIRHKEELQRLDEKGRTTGRRQRHRSKKLRRTTNSRDSFRQYEASRWCYLLLRYTVPPALFQPIRVVICSPILALVLLLCFRVKTEQSNDKASKRNSYKDVQDINRENCETTANLGHLTDRSTSARKRSKCTSDASCQHGATTGRSALESDSRVTIAHGSYGFKLSPTDLESLLESCPPKHENWKDYDNRLKSFDNAQGIYKERKALFAEIGLFLNGDIAVCFHCGGCHGDWENGDDPVVEHCRWFPGCQFIRRIMGDSFVEYIRTEHEKHLDMLAERGRGQANATHRQLVEKYFSSEDIGFYDAVGMSVDVLHLAACSFGEVGTPTREDVLRSLSNLCQLKLDCIPQNRKGVCPTLIDFKINAHVQDGYARRNHSAGHERLGPYGVNIRLPNPKHPEYESYDERHGTFVSFPHPITDTLNPEELADAGLFYEGIGDGTTCFYCGGRLTHWEPADDPYVEHERLFPHCEYIIQVMERRCTESGCGTLQPNSAPEAVLNEATAAAHIPAHSSESEGTSQRDVQADSSPQTQRMQRTHDVCGLYDSGAVQPEAYANRTTNYTIPHSRPAYQQYASLASREASFQSYPRSAKGSKEKMAKAGFFYTGTEDRTTCFQCGNTLCSWEDDDDPVLEHARWHPDCPYVTLLLGNDTVRDVSREHSYTLAERLATERSLSDVRAENLLPDLMSAQIVRRLLMQGIDRAIMETAMRKRLNSTGLIDVLDENDVRRALADAASLPENVRTREVPRAETGDLSKCVICKRGDRHTIFLPCSHLVTCSQCASQCSVCPSCNREITTRRDVFLA